MREGWCLLLLAACGSCAASSAPSPARAVGSAGQASPEQDRAHTASLAAIEEESLGWLGAADPRVAARLGRAPPEDIVQKVGTEGVLGEDSEAHIRGESLDLFAFRTRARVLDHAARAVRGFTEPLPDSGPAGGALARPKLERELLVRLVDEELARAADEARLGGASADLVRAIVSTWTPPSVPQDWPERDAWLSKRLLQIRDSLHDPRERLAPNDLDVALYPLERLLAPLQFPKGSAAIAEVRMALDADMRVVPRLSAPESLALEVKKHLGVTLDVAQLPRRLAEVQARLGALATAALVASGDGRRAIEGRARELLMVERPCPAVPDSPVRAMAPPPERGAVCGVLRALTEEERSGAALVALHDDVLLSFAAVVSVPPPRTGLLSGPLPADDVVDSLWSEWRASDRW